jgi:hypothetical protein
MNTCEGTAFTYKTVLRCSRCKITRFVEALLYENSNPDRKVHNVKLQPEHLMQFGRNFPTNILSNVEIQLSPWVP